jgi:hypothetical protein
MLRNLRSLLVFLSASSALLPVSGAIINLVPGVSRTDDPVTNVPDWTLDAGYVVDGTNDVIFEAGGDGTGVALVVIGSDLTVYQDRGDYLVSSPANDSMFSVNISEFAGSVISIRLDADLSTSTDILTLTATDGLSTVANAFTLPGDVANIAGGNDTGFGVTAADLAGIDEDADLLQFNGASFKGTGADILGADSLAGKLYVNESAPASIPAASSWGLTAVPESGSVLLIGLTGILAGLRRRR